MFKKLKTEEHYIEITFEKFNLIFYFSQCKHRIKYLKNTDSYSFKIITPESQKKQYMSTSWIVFDILIASLHAELELEVNSTEQVKKWLSKSKKSQLNDRKLEKNKVLEDEKIKMDVENN